MFNPLRCKAWVGSKHSIFVVSVYPVLFVLHHLNEKFWPLFSRTLKNMPDKQFLIGNGKDIITELVQKYKESIEKKKDRTQCHWQSTAEKHPFSARSEVRRHEGCPSATLTQESTKEGLSEGTLVRSVIEYMARRPEAVMASSLRQGAFQNTGLTSTLKAC